MPTWILIVIVAQVLYAIAAIVDKYIVTSKKVSKPFIYAFYVTVLSVVPIFLFVFGFFNSDIGSFKFPSLFNVDRPSTSLMAMAILAALAGFQGLISLYSALRETDASDVVPVVGSLSAIAAFLFSFLVLDEQLTRNFFLGFLFLVSGTLLIGHFRFNKKIVLLTTHAGLLFGIKATMMKFMFLNAGFDHVFFWTRIGVLIVVVNLLLVPRYNEKVKFNTTKTGVGKGGFWVIGNSILGGVAAFITLKAIDIGNVTIVQALGGLNFIFLTIISITLGRFIPESAGENNAGKDILHKIISIILVAIGFAFLFI